MGVASWIQISITFAALFITSIVSLRSLRIARDTFFVRFGAFLILEKKKIDFYIRNVGEGTALNTHVELLTDKGEIYHSQIVNSLKPNEESKLIINKSYYKIDDIKKKRYLKEPTPKDFIDLAFQSKKGQFIFGSIYYFGARYKQHIRRLRIIENEKFQIFKIHYYDNERKYKKSLKLSEI